MSEIASTALPQVVASKGPQSATSRARDENSATGEGGDAFSRVLDQQLANRREASRSEESARQHRAEGEAPAEHAAANAQATQAASTGKSGKKDVAEHKVAARDAAEASSGRVEADRGEDTQVAAGIAALLPALAGDAAKDADAPLSMQAGTQPTVPGGRSAATAGVAGPVAAEAAAGALATAGAAQSATGEKILPRAVGAPADEDGQPQRPDGQAPTELLEGDAVDLQRPRIVRKPAAADAPMAGVPTGKEAALQAAAAGGEAPIMSSTAGGGDGPAAQIAMQAGAAMRSHGSPAAQPMPAYIATPAGQPGWAEDVGNRVVLLAGRDESAAELILTPPQLGRVEVSIRVSGEHTTAHFVAATPAARDALEQAMPRLREVLAEAGISLGDANVNTQAQQQRGEGGNGGGHYRPRYENGIAGEGPVAVSQGLLRRSDGLVDTFA